MPAKPTERRIMMVDDDVDILDLMSYNLHRQGYEVLAMSDSTKAIDAAVEFCPHLFILDVMMPQIDGLSLCRHIRNKPSFKEAYIIFLSFVSDKDTIYEALSLGGDEYLEKISELRLLIEKIDQFFQRKIRLA